MAKKAKKPPRLIGKHENDFLDQTSTDLWEKLRALRLKLAKEQDIPPFIVFHNRTLRELAAYLPRSLEEMRDISGIGEHKLELYGEIFLDLILDYVRQSN